MSRCARVLSRGGMACGLALTVLGYASSPESTLVRGQDRPRVIVDATRVPFSSIGKLYGSMECTASVVLDPRIIVTSAHCVTGPQALADGIVFRPGYHAGTALATVHGHIARMGELEMSRVHTTRDEPNDWAIIVLDQRLTGVRPLAVPPADPSDLAPMERHIMMPGYSADVAGGDLLSAVADCAVRGREWGVLIHDCPCGKGASGAPLIAASEDWYALVGIDSAMFYRVAPGEKRVEVQHAAVPVASFRRALFEVAGALAVSMN